ncbi:MAG: pyridine nucleotide-disulfide oxidoreductase, partial [Burkholderiales bacterium]|nr:pyridine nucleotide-disulfide oxidoreductase [Burkholderiales bacterium]
MKRVVLLGGGHAHALLLLQWARRPTAGVQLYLVSPQPHSLYSGSVPGWLAGRCGAEALQIDLVSLCCAAGVRWLQVEAVALDAPAKQLQLAPGEQLPFDLLSINTGSTLSPPAHPGPLLTLRPLNALVQAWPRWLADWRRGHGAANLDMVGGGAAGVEVLLAVLAR